MFTAIHEGKPNRELLSYEYLQMLPQLAEGDANKVFVVPSEFAEAFGGIGEALSRRAPRSPSPQPPRPRAAARAAQPPLATQLTPPRAPRLTVLADERAWRLRESARLMFDALAEKLQATLADVRSRGTLTEQDVDAAMREIRLALLEADVNFKVVRQFTAQVKERCLGADVIGKLNPGQQVVKIVAEELTALMGGASAGLSFSPQPADRDPDGRAAGLGQDDRDREARPAPARGALARRSRWRRATSTARRPSSSSSRSARRRAPRSTSRAPSATRSRSPRGRWSAPREEGKDVLIVDTSGRLHVDEELMAELVRIRAAVKPDRRAARRRRDDRPGRGQRRRAVRRRRCSSTAS